MLHSILQEINPFKRLSYLEAYFSEIYSLNGTSKQKRATKDYRIQVPFSLYLLFMAVVPLSPWLRVILLDLEYHLGVPPNTTLTFLLVNLQIYYIHYLLYFKAGESDFTRLPYNILCLNRHSMFPFRFGPKNPIDPIERVVQKFAQKFLYYQQLFIASFGK